jgi:hypothetical protein
MPPDVLPRTSQLCCRASLAGRVRDADQCAVRGALVVLRLASDVPKLADDPQQALRSTVSNADGSFRFIDLATADYELSIRATLETPQRRITLEAVKTVSIPIEQENACGDPLPPVFVTIDLPSTS